MTRGFLLGKFMPLHEGHVFLIEVAARMVDELSVLVCTRDCEPIDGQLRADWVRASVPRNVRVLHMHRDIPQEPEDDPDFWPIWRKAIRDLCPEPLDYVFGSEPYVNRLAAELSAKPHIMDPERELFDISGTRIRENPAAHWDYIPKAVRSYYQKRICFLGAESVGKSYFSKLFAGKYGTRFMPEYGRTYDESVHGDAAWTDYSLNAIGEGHVAMRDVLERDSGPVFFDDTDILQTIIWAQHLLGHVPPRLEELAATTRLADAYILLKSDVEWVDDGTRQAGEMDVRDWFFRELKAQLDKRGLAYRIVEGGDWAAREAAAQTYIEEITGLRPLDVTPLA